MLEADYLRRQAEACSQLSQTTFDLGLARRLRTMADEFRRKATDLERDAFASEEGQNNSPRRN